MFWVFDTLIKDKKLPNSNSDYLPVSDKTFIKNLQIKHI
tara:strand:+ start:6233 stop:6349 length:117 start_codon:yes stop_codon:yes gene_type:complete